jgi:prepilin-type N-terminal cleavage/methylation domain-containing protein
MIMKTRVRRSRPGFSLIEVLIGLAIFSVVLLALYTVFIWSHQTYVSGTRRQDVQQTTRLAMDQMVRQLRMAGYMPENFDTDPANDIPVPPANNPFGVPRIFMASSTALAVFGSPDGSAATSSVSLFCLSGTQLLSKNGAPDNVDSYTCSGAGNVIADNVTAFSLTYFGLDTSSPRQLTQLALAANGYLDGAKAPPFNAGAATTALGKAAAALSFPVGAASVAAANRQAVRIIRIQLTVTESGPQQNQAYTLNSTVELRNNSDNN